MKVREKSETRAGLIIENNIMVRSAIGRQLGMREVETLRLAQRVLQEYKSEDSAGFAAIIRFVARFGLSYEQLAKSCGVSPGTVSRWASGDVCPIQPAREAVIQQISKWLDQIVATGDEFCTSISKAYDGGQILSLRVKSTKLSLKKNK